MRQISQHKTATTTNTCDAPNPLSHTKPHRSPPVSLLSSWAVLIVDPRITLASTTRRSKTRAPAPTPANQATTRSRVSERPQVLPPLLPCRSGTHRPVVISRNSRRPLRTASAPPPRAQQGQEERAACLRLQPTSFETTCHSRCC